MTNKGKTIVVRGNRSELSTLYQRESNKPIERLNKELIEAIVFGIMKGLSSQDACAVARVPPHKFDEWYGAGKALAERSDHPGIPALFPRQVDEDINEYNSRKDVWIQECDLLYDFFILCNASKQHINESMLTVIHKYAVSGKVDSWRAAREMIKMTGGPEYNRDYKTVQQHHEHVVSGEISHTHKQQVHTIIDNLIEISGTAIEETVIEEDSVGN